jgi:hypothetical protein
MSDNTMITVYPFDGSLYTFYESPYVYRIEPNSLETQGLMDLGKLGLISHSRYSLLAFSAGDQGSYRPWQAGAHLTLQVKLVALSVTNCN